MYVETNFKEMIHKSTKCIYITIILLKINEVRYMILSINMINENYEPIYMLYILNIRFNIPFIYS